MPNLLYGPYNLYCALGAIFAQAMNTKHMSGEWKVRFNKATRGGEGLCAIINSVGSLKYKVVCKSSGN